MTDRDLSRDLSQDERPEPFSTSDCDLRGLEWMPLDAANLLDSTLWLESDGWEFKAAMGLICKSWRQVPAGSLPNSELALSQLASVPVPWEQVRTMAMRNWVLCRDNRWYHPIVAAKAMEALPMRQEFAEKKTADAERKARERQDRKDLFARLKAAGITPKWDTKTGELRRLAAALPTVPAAPGPTEKDDGAPGLSQHLSQDLSRDLSRLGQGQGQGHSLENPSGSVGGTPAAPDPTPPAPTPAPPAPTKRARKAKGESEEAQPGELLDGPKQRSCRPYRKCPDTFRLTGAMVTWAGEEYPILDLDEIRKATRAFLNHRFKTARIEWVPTWENWIKEEAERKASRARPAAGFSTAPTPRQERVAQHFAAAAERPIHRGPPPRPVTTVPQGEIEDVEPRPPARIGR